MANVADIFVPIGGAVSVAAVAAAMGWYYTREAVADHQRRTREAELAAELKRQMIDKGYSVDDIVRVVAAHPGQTAKA